MGGRRDTLRSSIERAADAVRERCELSPKVCVILGTGLGTIGEGFTETAAIPFESIPGFPKRTVSFHAGVAHLGRAGHTTVLFYEGRYHLYEGYSAGEVVFPVRVARALGAEILIASNAAGGMNPDYRRGEMVLITDHINLLGANPLIGSNDDTLGPRFPDMFAAYSPRLLKLAESVASAQALSVKRGVYVGVTGPNLETPAEYRFLRGIGADMVGMSTVPEVIAAVHAGMEVLGISCVTDLCTPETLEPADIERIIAVAKETVPKINRLIMGVIEKL